MCSVKTILILLLVIFVALYICSSFSRRPSSVTEGGSEYLTSNLFNFNPYYGGAPTNIAEGVYESIKEHLRNVGTAKHIEEHLGNLLDVKKVEISDLVKTLHTIPENHKKLYELIIIAAERTGADSPQELILLFDISYQWFLPEDKRKILLKAKIDNNVNKMSIIEELVGKTSPSLLGAERDNVAKKVDSIGVLYKKFEGDISKKTASVLKRSGKVSLDTVGISGIIKLLSENTSGVKTSKAPESIRDKLDNINLISMYTREPYLVKSFIERISKDIKTIEYNTDPYKYSIAPLTTLMALTQRDINDSEQRKLAIERRDLEKQRNDLLRQAIGQNENLMAAQSTKKARPNLETNTTGNAADNAVGNITPDRYTPAPHRFDLNMPDRYTPAPHRVDLDIFNENNINLD